MNIINSDSFESTVKNGVVLVDFFATWCGPCKMLTPVLEELSSEMSGKVEFAKVDIDQDQQLAMQFKIMSVPTMILFKDGQPVKQLQGYMPKPQLENEIKAIL